MTKQSSTIKVSIFLQAWAMASVKVDTKLCFSVAAILLVFAFSCSSGNAEYGGGGDYYGSGVGGFGYADPARIVARALVCFNNNYIYKSCAESYRLDQSGDLNVPPDGTLAYCTGPCLRETDLVLDCINGILDHFMFYNRATVRDVRDTIRAGCSYGPERGHFDVSEHMAAESAGASRVPGQILIQLTLMAVGRFILLGHV
ncbi:hypothetical protein SAY86_014799 [Trapa natans]|uniref:DUF7731 domain-containing protein n=1 Tax=Trapa natans TaxID=22666 RepID=A0AAN7KLV1_TRANT|nr:hypothetical protein SAY86_014799 [Trapa natans]